MTTVGRWSPNKVRQRLLQDSWAFPNSGMVLMRPSSIAFSGVTASITVNGSVSFSAVTSLSLNGVFTSAYDNYMIVIRHVLSSGTDGTAMYVRLRSSGTDATTGYTWQYLYANGTSVTGARDSTEGYARAGMFSTSQRSGDTAWIYGPFLSQPTAFRNVNAGGFSSGTLIDYASTHSTSSSYDGVTILPSLGSITGLVSVYGLGG